MASEAEERWKRLAALGVRSESPTPEGELATDVEGDHKFCQQPCPFLGTDDRCRIYSVRPTDCREYPHTNKKWFTSRTMAHASNALICPAVFWIVEQMRS